MALPSPTPPQKRVFILQNKCCFLLIIHMWETCISGIPREKTVTGEINNCFKEQKKRVLPTESPGKRKYASSLTIKSSMASLWHYNITRHDNAFWLCYMLSSALHSLSLHHLLLSKINSDPRQCEKPSETVLSSSWAMYWIESGLFKSCQKQNTNRLQFHGYLFSYIFSDK